MYYENLGLRLASRAVRRMTFFITQSILSPYIIILSDLQEYVIPTIPISGKLKPLCAPSEARQDTQDRKSDSSSALLLCLEHIAIQVMISGLNDDCGG